MNGKAMRIIGGFALWLAGVGLALAQSNAIESFDVTEQAGKVIVRVTTKEPLRSVPPNFAVASPARIAFDFPNTANALGRASQDIGQGARAACMRSTMRRYCRSPSEVTNRSRSRCMAASMRSSITV